MADKPGFSSHETSSRENGEEIPSTDISSSNETGFSYHMEAGTASKSFKVGYSLQLTDSACYTQNTWVEINLLETG